MTEVFIFAAPHRALAHEQCYASLRASDIGEDFTICEHPPGITPAEHWRATHERAAKATSEFVLVLEDDVLVNTHILHNIQTWRWKHDVNFGAGWLYSPGGYAQKDCWYSGDWEWHGTCGVLYRTACLSFLIDTAWQRMLEHQRPWDCAMAWACHLDGRRIRHHYPALVEHLWELPSAVGNPPGGRRHSGGTFRQDWRRSELGDPNGTIDERGRKVV